MNILKFVAFWIGVLLMMFGTGVIDEGLYYPHTFSVGMIAAAAGLMILFSLNKENRNTNRIRRLARYYWSNIKSGNFLGCFF
jgi:hypothetical protein